MYRLKMIKNNFYILRPRLNVALKGLIEEACLASVERLFDENFLAFSEAICARSFVSDRFHLDPLREILVSLNT